MKIWLADIAQVWRQKFAFKAAILYLTAFILLAVLLPWLPLPYQPNELDLQHIFQPPFQFSNTAGATHWLGTDKLGRDILANTLYGARTALFISLPVMLLSTFTGLILGVCAGYFGDRKLKISLAAAIIFLLLITCSIYYGLYIPLQATKLQLVSEVIFISYAILLLGIALLVFFILPVLKKIPVLSQHIFFPVDTIILRLTETITSIPRLILILALASFVAPSVMLLSLILILTYWTTIARLARAEMLRLKQLPFIEAGISIGTSDYRLLWKHALPNIISPVTVSFAFGLAGLMTLESTLSFLGIGVPATLTSWGRTISDIRTNTSAWWLIAFPGAFLGLTVLALQTCAYYFLSSIKDRKHI